MIMKKAALLILLALSFVACEKQNQILYDESGGLIHFSNSAINLEIDREMKIKTSYMKNGEKLSIVSEQSKPNDFLVINGIEVSQFPIEKTELNDIHNEFGEGKQLKLFGKSTISTGLDKSLYNSP